MRASSRDAPRKPSRGAQPEWSDLLVKAVNIPGVISSAYHQFWNYSVGNQFLALFQCMQRGIEPGPIHTFVGWRDLGRHVKKGQKALMLCMPVTVKCKSGAPVEESDDGAEQLSDGAGEASADATTPTRTCFVYRPHWFVLSQTEGREYEPAELPQWSEARALGALKIERIPFRHTDGNAQGYAMHRQVAISPIAFMPRRTLMHEVAHVELGHTEEVSRMDDDDSATPRDLREVEAECVALICCSSLGLGGEEFSRGYIQHWLKGQSIPERSAHRIFKAADRILKAGCANGE